MAGLPGEVAELGAYVGRRRWTFGRAEFEERTLQLSVDGVVQEVERKSLEVLRHLLDHAGDVVTKDELLDSVWPGRLLSNTVLMKSVGKLREVLHDDQFAIKTVHGYGYRFVAPVKVTVTERSEAPAHFDFKNGDHPPLRPLWSLIERLGTGGHGEAWLVRHDKTDEARVLKFAKDDAALSGLKREVTLFRLLTGSLGNRAEIVHVLDWNFAQAPFFVESEYVRDGSLTQWARMRGGVHDLPLDERVELIARIAEAVSAMHSVGVLHKDLKPSNVLVVSQPAGPPRIKLGDFGSGGLLDRSRLEAMDITRMGFTHTRTALATTSGTPLYLAPELLAGQPSTVQADVYSLGVMLYQIVVADFHRQLTTGWEREIEDEILREDIAQAAAGDPQQRLGDAGEFARRLRSLATRRAERQGERHARAKAEAEERARDRWKARRAAMIVALVVLAVGLVVSTRLYLNAIDAQKRTEVAAAQSQAVTEYLSKDVFAPISSGTAPVKDITVTELLTRAGDEIDTRFADQPKIASELHFVMGRSFNEFFSSAMALQHFERAMELGAQLDGTGSEIAMRSASELILLNYALGNLRERMPRYDDMLRVGRQQLAPNDPALIELRQRLARGHYYLGDWSRSARELESLLAEIPRSTPQALEFVGKTELLFGRVLTELARYPDAKVQLLAAIKDLGSALGPDHLEVSDARSALGLILVETGQYADAKAQLDQANVLALRWTTPNNWTVHRTRFFTALMLIAQNRPADAGPLLKGIVSYRDEHAGEYAEIDATSRVRQALGEVYGRQGHVAEAVSVLQRALAVSAKFEGPQHPTTLSIRMSLAEWLLAAGRGDDAIKALREPTPIQLSDLPPPASHGRAMA